MNNNPTPYEEGTSGNLAGRTPGTLNKAATAAREVVSDALADALAGTDAATLQAKLNAFDGKDFIDAYVKLAEFITPKLQRTALATEEAKWPIKVALPIGGRTPEERETNRLNNQQAAWLLGK